MRTGESEKALSAPLKGIRILDLSRALAGPWCVQNLADLGAEVIKIERPGTGDESRHWGPPWLRDGDGRSTGESAYFLSTNRNKRSVAIDIGNARGQELVRRLADDADVLVENFKVGNLSRFGLDWATLSGRNPSLIYCSITGFGQDGPYAERPGYDYLFQGLGGVMSVTGAPGHLDGAGAQRVGLPVVDMFTGMYATVAVLGALHHRTATGEGQHIDVSLFDSVMALGAGQISNYFVGGEVPQRVGNSSPNIAPYQVFPCADGEMILACANQQQFESLCRAIEQPRWISDTRFRNNAARVAHRPELEALLTEVFRTRGQMEWEEILSAVGVPCGPINDYARAVAHPQALHRGTRVDLPHVVGSPAPGIASPIRYSATPVEYRSAPPILGQHTHEVLESLGLAESEIRELESDAVIESAARAVSVRDTVASESRALPEENRS
ncbi:MAG: CoA transferase [Burkholderiaceae bacterium]|nr:CoA transferase [Burkholderiaceae bacterium]